MGDQKVNKEKKEVEYAHEKGAKKRKSHSMQQIVVVAVKSESFHSWRCIPCHYPRPVHRKIAGFA